MLPPVIQTFFISVNKRLLRLGTLALRILRPIQQLTLNFLGITGMALGLRIRLNATKQRG